MIYGIDFRDPDTLWRVGLSTGIVLLALIAIGWIGMLRARMSKRAKAQAPVAAESAPPGRLSHLLLSLAAIAAAAWALLRVWGYDVSSLLQGDDATVLGSVLRAAMIIALATVAIEFTSFAAHLMAGRIIHGKTKDRRRLAKVRTVAPLISGLANAIIIFIALAMVLSEAGVEVAPLLAGAGVAGIAIGFGAQSLVKDLFTGAFLIIEDIVSHGDVVEIAGVTGSVEAMTMRTIRLRSFDGTLHIFPYGEAQVIHNKTASFSSFAFELQVSYMSSIDDALAVLRRVGEQICSDKDLSQLMIGKLDLVGVDRLHDNGVIIKGRIRTLAGENARVGSAFLKLAKEKLDEAGVLISHRHQAVPPFDEIRELVSAPRGGKNSPAAHPN